MREEKAKNEHAVEGKAVVSRHRSGSVFGSHGKADGVDMAASATAPGVTSAARENSSVDHAGRRIQVLSRAVDILQVIGRTNGDLSLGKIAREVDLPRSTVQRIVNALQAENLIAAGPEGRGYKIGSLIQQLAEATRPDVPQCLHPLLQSLSVDTGETVDLAVCRDQTMVFLDQVPGQQRLRAVSAIGEVFPMTVTANGKAVLAMMDPGVVGLVLQRERESGITGKSESDLLRELEQVHGCGVSVDLDQHTPGISAVGTAFRYRGLDYAISIPVPTDRFRRNRATMTRRLQLARTEIVKVLPDVEIPGVF
jgi:DNA-binding IclR family transcriptional regulator